VAALNNVDGFGHGCEADERAMFRHWAGLSGTAAPPDRIDVT
jgi:hypothetical protein